MYKWYHMVFFFVCLTYFTYHNTFQVYLCCYKWQSFIPLYGWVVFHCIYIPYLLYPSSVDGHLGRFHILASINKAVMNIAVHVSFLISLSSFEGDIYPGLKFLGHMVVVFLRTLNNRNCFHCGCIILHPYQQCIRFSFLCILASIFQLSSFWW